MGTVPRLMRVPERRWQTRPSCVKHTFGWLGLSFELAQPMLLDRRACCDARVVAVIIILGY